MAKRCSLALLLAALFFTALFRTSGGPSPGAEAPAGNKRLAYTVKYGSAQNLATTLGTLFKGDAAVQVLVDAPSNCLLLSAPPPTLDTIVKLLEHLDRRPQRVAVEVLVACLPARNNEGEKKEAEEKEFTGPRDKIVARLREWHKKGQVSELKHFQFTAVENQKAVFGERELRPVVLDVRNSNTDGSVSRAVEYRDVTTHGDVALRVVGDNTVVVRLEVYDQFLVVPEVGVILGSDEKGMPIRAAERREGSVETKLTVPSGQAVAVTGIRTTSRSEQETFLLVVTARLLEADVPEKK
jgi:type II secretory pathway component GspD/PulD (secretin)